ncbi:hypothetical protein Trydic_g6027 [Trypoxylus dichotomus]
MVCGLREVQIQKKLLGEDGNLSFQRACEIALSMEVADAQSVSARKGGDISKNTAEIEGKGTKCKDTPAPQNLTQLKSHLVANHVQEIFHVLYGSAVPPVLRLRKAPSNQVGLHCGDALPDVIQYPSGPKTTRNTITKAIQASSQMICPNGRHEIAA